MSISALFPAHHYFTIPGTDIAAVGYKLYVYLAGGNTKAATQTESSGATDNANPVTIGADGTLPFDMYGTDGVAYDIVLAPPGDTDPPASGVELAGDYYTLSFSSIIGVGHWINTITATYGSATTFTLVGDQTTNFAVGRRIKMTGGADRYALVKTSVYSSPNTTITVVETVDSGGVTAVLHASMGTALTSVLTVDGLRGAIPVEGIADAGGTADALTATFYPPIPLTDKVTVLLRAASANATTTPTFAPNGGSATTIVKNNSAALSVGDIAGADHVLMLQRHASNNNWNLLNPSDGGASSFDAGTIMLFQQTAAPTGWTKETTHNNKSLRVVTGSASSGGADNFSTVFGSSKATASHALSVSEMPAHTHGLPWNDALGGSSGTPATTNNSTAVEATDSIGGDGGHTHNLTMDLQYVDLILAARD